MECNLVMDIRSVGIMGAKWNGLGNWRRRRCAIMLITLISYLQKRQMLRLDGNKTRKLWQLSLSDSVSWHVQFNQSLSYRYIGEVLCRVIGVY